MTTKKPNILFITIDQLRADCLETRSERVVKTPNLDSLAAQGVRFANHFTQASPCGPSRASLLTGTYLHTHQSVFNGTPLDDKFTNLAKEFRAAGYDPLLFGYTDTTIDPRTVDENDKYNSNSIQGRLHQKKDIMSWEMIKKMYLEPKYISPCHAGSLFGIISSKGKIHPCEILEGKELGDLRENDMDFMKIWNNQKTKDTKNFILKSKCNCTYECALSYNILGNWRYQTKLAAAALKLA